MVRPQSLSPSDPIRFSVGSCPCLEATMRVGVQPGGHAPAYELSPPWPLRPVQWPEDPRGPEEPSPHGHPPSFQLHDGHVAVSQAGMSWLC